MTIKVKSVWLEDANDEKVVPVTTDKQVLTKGGQSTLELDWRDLDNRLRDLDNRKRDKSEKLTKDDFDISSNDKKIGLINLQDEVIQAITGNAPVNNVIADNAITREKIADGAVSPEKTNFINNEVEVIFERGTIAGGREDDTPWSKETRFRTKDMLKNVDRIVRLDPNFLIGVVTYDDGVYDGVERGWLDEDIIEIDDGKDVRFAVRKRDSSVISDEEFFNSQKFKVYSKFTAVNNYDFIKLKEETGRIKEQIFTKEKLNANEYESGTILSGIDGSLAPYPARVRLKEFKVMSKGDVIRNESDDLNFGVAVYNFDRIWDGVDYGWIEKEFKIQEDCLVKIVVRFKDNREIVESDYSYIANSIVFETSVIGSIKNKDVLNYSTRQLNAINSINVEYGRLHGASYVFVRIPTITNDGGILRPIVALTSLDGSLSGEKRSVLEYVRDKNSIFTLNASLFNMATREPVGQTIIDGISIINEPMEDDNGVPIHPEECYPLAIDGDGNLTTYPKNADTQDMINDGIKYAVTGWGRLVNNFEIDQESINNEIVHGGKRNIRQAIGQYQNGDYCVCTVDGRITNEAGMYYEELAQIFVDKGVKFAYALDGGGSAQTVLGKRILNPIYEGPSGRKVPTVIEFILVDND